MNQLHAYICHLPGGCSSQLHHPPNTRGGMVLTEHWVKLPVLYSTFPLAIYLHKCCAVLSHSVASNSWWHHGLYSPLGSSAHRDFPEKNTGVGCHALLQGIFPTQGSNPGLQHCGQMLYHLSYQGSPRIVEWVAYPFSMGSSWPRNWTRIACIAGGFFTSWATRWVLRREAWWVLRRQIKPGGAEEMRGEQDGQNVK